MSISTPKNQFHLMFVLYLIGVLYYSFSALEGYDTYDFPPGFDPGTSTCTSVAPDGRGLPEQVSTPCS